MLIAADDVQEFVFHSIFACPVSKDQSTDTNPPMLLPCGHVLCQVSTHYWTAAFSLLSSVASFTQRMHGAGLGPEDSEKPNPQLQVPILPRGDHPVSVQTYTLSSVHFDLGSYRLRTFRTFVSPLYLPV